jgi:thiol-disulfide isomerase/thioredoxin
MTRFAKVLANSALALILIGCRERPSAETESAESAQDLTCPNCCPPMSRASLLQQAAAPAAIELKNVKLDELQKELEGHPGKLVLLDVWADYCIPCKKGFPHLLELHRQYAKDGLVCVSVCVDELKNREAALKFLTKQRADFTHYLLTNRAEDWQDHWNISAIPAAFLYRDGKLIARFDSDDPDHQFTYEDVDKAVAKLLKRSPSSEN